MVRKSIYFILFYIFIVSDNYAQLITNYDLEVTSGAYEDLSGAQVISSPSWDDGSFPVDIEFPFTIYGQIYDRLSINMNGLLEFDAPENDKIIISAFGADLLSKASDRSPISYITSGEEPFRIFKVEWKNAGMFDEWANLQTLNNYVNVQVWLYEGSNKIEMRYGPNLVRNAKVIYSGYTSARYGIYNSTALAQNRSICGHFIEGDQAAPRFSHDYFLYKWLSSDPVNGTIYTLISGEGFLEIKERPFISSFVPLAGFAGTRLIISGEHFQDLSSLMVDDVPLNDLRLSDKGEIVASIPKDASSGKLTIKTKWGEFTTDLDLVILDDRVCEGRSGLVKDIAPGTKSAFKASDGYFTQFAEHLFFLVDEVESFTLYRTNGCSNNTHRIMPRLNRQILYASDNFLYFSADNRFYAMDKHFNLTVLQDSWSQSGYLNGCVLKNRFLFEKEGALWSFHETSGNLQRLSNDGMPNNLFEFQGKAYFSRGNALFATDGLIGQHMKILDHQVRKYGKTSKNLYLVALNNGIQELYICDGTAQGTYLIHKAKDYGDLVEVDGEMYFQAYHDDTGWELHITDGRSVRMIRDLDEGANNGILYTSGIAANDQRSRYRPVACKGILYFAGRDEKSGYELWRSDGTSAGTYMVKDILPGEGSSTPEWMTVAGDRIYFSAAGGENEGFKRELWTSDGTLSGTYSIKAEGASPYYITVFNDALFYVGISGAAGRELFRFNIEDVPLGYERSLNAPTIEVYPNPFNTRMRIVGDGSTVWQRVVVINGTGLPVYSNEQATSDMEIDLSHLQAGIYQVMLQAGTQTFNRTVVKF